MEKPIIPIEEMSHEEIKNFLKNFFEQETEVEISDETLDRLTLAISDQSGWAL